MKSVSKKKLQTKMKKVTDKLNAKNEDKVKLRRELNDAKKDTAYWEERASEAEQKLEGSLTIDRPISHTCVITHMHAHTRM